MSCFRCKRTGMKVCDSECPLGHDWPCDDCALSDERRGVIRSSDRATAYGGENHD